ncbi:PREDICTED: protein UBASH3A homolog [Priapulus caudatus]|uniref:Protein UBASH3A homolog n=1 Tax=Priapulus caudatus TaxID=37621 RepID=A0ABM1EDN9_PRICU|nr:PREDICTED: protein UBASH3A homolog [Priapulus caudatus]
MDKTPIPCRKDSHLLTARQPERRSEDSCTTSASLADCIRKARSELATSLPGGGATCSEAGGGRRLHVVRHGERVDFTFGGDWFLENCFDSSGNYRVLDANLPTEIPRRAGAPATFDRDCPLTKVGVAQAAATGVAMSDAGVAITRAYSSPALRCVQTAREILAALGVDRQVALRIEPALFEWMTWFREIRPTFLTAAEMLDFGFNIDTCYESIMEDRELHIDETLDEYYARSHRVMRAIVAAATHDDDDILVVAHGASLDVLTRNLIGRLSRDEQEFQRVLSRTPYCSAAACEQTPDGWRLVAPPARSLRHEKSFRHNILEVLQ